MKRKLAIDGQQISTIMCDTSACHRHVRVRSILHICGKHKVKGQQWAPPAKCNVGLRSKVWLGSIVLQIIDQVEGSLRLCHLWHWYHLQEVLQYTLLGQPHCCEGTPSIHNLLHACTHPKWIQMPVRLKCLATYALVPPGISGIDTLQLHQPCHKARRQ